MNKTTTNMSYSRYVGNRVLPAVLEIEIKKSLIAYMKVEDVLRYLNIINRSLPIHQYKIGEEPNHFFLAKDVCHWVEEHREDGVFRVMECHVITYLVEDK